MRLLLHCCCGPCSIAPIEVLREEGHILSGYFYNPNIHPYTEYRKRRDTLSGYAETVGLPLIVRDSYDLETFLRGAMKDLGERCRSCYGLRLEETAKVAAGEGFDAFSTTLLVSPYQKHDAIVQEAERASKEVGVDFLYRDFRPFYQEATRRSREMGLYRQPYCGCIFSEMERYGKTRE